MTHNEILDALGRISTVRKSAISYMVTVNMAQITIESIICNKTFTLGSIHFELFHDSLYAEIRMIGETLKIEFQFTDIIMGNQKLFFARDKFKTLIVEVGR